jgi:hypothetical protein
MVKMISFTVPMKINSEKKHSVRYDAVDKEAGIQSVYVMRSSLPAKIPQTLSVKVEMENE